MPFHIVLQNPPKVCTAGSVLQGKVILESAADEPVDSVTIQLSGVSKSKFKEDGSYSKSSASNVLFCYTERLFEGGYTLSRAQKHEWPFRFVFPSKAVHLVMPRLPARSEWPYTQDSPLPPSFVFSCYAFGGDMECSVGYTLEACLTRPATTLGLLARDRKAARAFRFSPPRSEPSPTPTFTSRGHIWHVASYKLLPEYQSRELTTREKMRSIVGGLGKIPTAQFQITIKLPNLAIQGQKIPILIGATLLPASSTIPATVAPEVKVRSLSLSATMITRLRGDTSTRRMDTLQSADKIHIAEQTDDLNIPLTSTPQTIDVLGIHAITQNFDSPNIRRGYSNLQLEVGLACVDRKEVVTVCVPSFKILGAQYMGPLLSEPGELVAASEVGSLPAPPPFLSREEYEAQAIVIEELPPYTP
ncbi:hypothetical protein FQN52_000705 [Onygenales sp. PD_12]|nr:hypothetical protein FQN52_000705 [Onygenales sp. PD_12]KAK2804845.1 hypothetical protein FQN51_001487 [Onygenales sp. PD_10]